MKLTPVESSHIAAIGYLEDERVLLVRYTDGSLYAQPGWSATAYEILIQADSKGKMLQACKNPAVKILGSEYYRNVIDALKSQMTTEVGPAVELTTHPLNLIDEDADKCCRKDLASALQSDAIKEYVEDGGKELRCRECGQVFRLQEIWPNRYWRIVPQVHIVRGK